MQLVEQHVIDSKDPRYKIIDDIAFKSKNLYNAALYQQRQSFIFQRKYISYSQMDKLMQQHEAYKALSSKVAQRVLDQLDNDWRNYFKACKKYQENPEKFLGHPRLPKYKHKTDGRNLLTYTDQTVSKRALKKGIVKLTRLPIQIKTKLTEVDQVRIVPRNGYYIIEIIYTRQEQQTPEWKQEVQLGKRNNQNFVQIPHARFINMLSYKAQLVGIQVIITEESYTSKCSFLDREPIRKHKRYMGKRVKRGLFRSAKGHYINADINGSYNIIRKVAPKLFEGVEGFVVSPVRTVRAKQTMIQLTILN